MAISKDLFLAILAMDAYNRGYGAGIADEGEYDLDGLGQAPDTAIGFAKITANAETDLDPRVAQTASFYAIAYEATEL